MSITVDSPSKNNKIICGDTPTNLGSDENLLTSEVINEDSKKESHTRNNLGNWSPNLQIHEAAAAISPSIVEAGLGSRNGFSSLQVPFSLGRSSKDADSICTAQSHIMGSEKFDPTTEWYS